MSQAASSVAFHTGVLDPVEHAMRLTRKALAHGSRVLVVGPEAQLGALDEQLWTADPGGFVPHLRWSREAQGSTRLSRAQVWLTSQPEALLDRTAQGERPDVLINLGADMSLQAAQPFAKVIDLVSTDPAARAAGQQRWRAWREQGVTPVHHAFS